jgi:hypothetical protein
LTLTSLLVVKPGAKERPEEPESCQADVNNDGLIDAQDLGLLLAFWGEDGVNENGWDPDLNDDGVVDAGDLGVLLGFWGECTEL